ncbi:hypothetical protein N0V83_000692 [Neocucurbitaria cava]|uniref:Uncharacterized protein n=1 Tax=Neocucurbitaria cava TaxID=798079 RepID=A0A9W8YH76_9PLEO|nr:hypothetical protein N0V83_000692 [Neocucurbitaria cava]
MTTRSPLQPLSPPSTNIINTRYARITATGPNGTVTMEERIQEDTQDLGSVVSGLSSLENDADDFEKLMIQNARDERRLNEALHGRVQAFRKARTHPRVGLTIDNLERNNARNDAAVGTNAHVKFESPPSSSGSTRSDPAIHAPPGWGRKSRTNRNWMRTITYEADEDEDQNQQTPRPADDTPNGRYHDSYQQHVDDAQDANIPRRSVEDSPLSHKSSIQGTPRNDRSAEWDLTFEINEASIIASTPYIPRNTALDDIRQREMESLREQAVTTARLDRIREGSPEQTLKRPRSSSAKSVNIAPNGASNTEQATQGADSPQKKLRTRTNSWQSIGKSQPVTGVGKEDSLTAMYKSAETVGTVGEEVLVNSQKYPSRPTRHRREDSQDLLRRLARVSNTPSPGRVAASRPQTVFARQTDSSTQATVTVTAPAPTEREEEPVVEAPEPDDVVEPAVTTEEPQAPRDAGISLEPVPEPVPEAEDGDADATPMPMERSILNPKTPVVTGAWVETPGPRTIRKLVSTLRSPSNNILRKDKSPEKTDAPTMEETLETVTAEVSRPQLPSSALQALVQEAKANGREHSTDYGDSTINSLEDLITPLAANAGVEVDEDTLQGLQLPTSEPRNEAERQRQQELLHLHRMNDRLRTVRTNIRDASRGMKRVEDRVEHAEEEGENGTKGKIVYTACPCATNGGHQFSLWKWWKSLFWQEGLKTERQAKNSRWKFWGGLTGLGIFLMLFFTWWISEEIAWYVALS